MKALLVTCPLLTYILLNIYMTSKFELSKEKSRLVLYLSIPVYMTFSYIYDFNLTTLIYSLAMSVVFSATAIDLDKHLIPNENILLLLILGVVNVLLNLHMAKLLLLGFVLTFTFGLVLYLITKGSIGGGDIKMLSALGLMVGYYNIYIIVLLSFSVSAIVGLGRIMAKKATAKTPMPFGPFIAFGFLVVSFI